MSNFSFFITIHSVFCICTFKQLYLINQSELDPCSCELLYSHYDQWYPLRNY